MKNVLAAMLICILITLIGCSTSREIKSNTNISKPTQQAKSANSQTSSANGQNLDSWIGDYVFTERVDSKDYSKFYEIFISKENNTYFAKISIYDEYAGVYNHVQAKVNGEANHIDFIFNSYLEDEENSNKPFNIGDKLLSFSKTETGIRTHWDKIAPVKDINKIDGTYFKIRENSDGFVGPWYTSLPYTRGNSTTINIKEMTNTSVSFHLYFCRTYT